jgi:hypothetical protein
MKTFLSIIFFLGMVISARAVDVTITWDLNPPSDMVERYMVFHARDTNSFQLLATVTGTLNLYTVRYLVPGKHRFMIVATNSMGTSIPSSEIVIPTNPPTQVKNVKTTNSPRFEIKDK